MKKFMHGVSLVLMMIKLIDWFNQIDQQIKTHEWFSFLLTIEFLIGLGFIYLGIILAICLMDVIYEKGK